MHVSATRPSSPAYARQPAATPAAPHASAPAARPSPSAAPAATVSLSGGIPASVKPEDRAAYQQFLRSMGGNQMAALAALRAKEAAEGEA